jgi:hypothetical protein
MHHRAMVQVQAVKSQAEQRPDYWPAENASNSAADHHGGNASCAYDKRHFGQNAASYVQQSAAAQGNGNADNDSFMGGSFHAAAG